MNTITRRELLVVYPSPSQFNIEELVDLSLWHPRVVHSVESGVEAAKLDDIAVGLIVLDSPAITPLHLEPLVLKVNTTWIAATSREWLCNPECLQFVLHHVHDYHTLPVDQQRLMFALGHAHGVATLRQRINDQKGSVERYGMVGNNVLMQDLYARIARITSVDAPVLVLGESGTGKELVARAIHQHSSRKNGPFFPVNCASLSSTLVQSELFGHEKGAFTGASQRKVGSIEAASGGTIFVDEIGDLPLNLQANLLRFLQEKTISRLGSPARIRIDVRVIAATHVDLQKAVRDGHFREDLYYRLNVLHIEVPPLRARPDDIEALALQCLRSSAGPKGSAVRGFSREAIRVMREYQWPGNVRELFNRVQSALIMSENRLITPADLGLHQRINGHQPGATLKDARASMDENIVRMALQNNASNISMAARELGVSRVTLYRLMDKFNLRSA
jgi:DNA-binding NtrC family response regulator